ncbi:hypothetical protein PPACK8108_LOCUS3480, partial [Phakopsora pachyrhizi]
MKSRPEKGKAYMTGKTCMTKAFLDNKEVKSLLDGGVSGHSTTICDRSVRLKLEFVLMKNAITMYFIIENSFQTLYGIDSNQIKERSFKIGYENKREKFAFIKSIMKDSEKSSDEIIRFDITLSDCKI